jgi:hypothetical protein
MAPSNSFAFRRMSAFALSSIRPIHCQSVQHLENGLSQRVDVMLTNLEATTFKYVASSF